MALKSYLRRKGRSSTFGAGLGAKCFVTLLAVRFPASNTFPRATKTLILLGLEDHMVMYMLRYDFQRGAWEDGETACVLIPTVAARKLAAAWRRQGCLQHRPRNACAPLLF